MSEALRKALNAALHKEAVKDTQLRILRLLIQRVDARLSAMPVVKQMPYLFAIESAVRTAVNKGDQG